MTSSKIKIEIWSFEITYNHISDADLDMFSSCSPLAAGQQLLTFCLTDQERSLNSYVSATTPPICLHICCTVFNSSKFLNMAAIPPFGLYPVPTNAQGFAQCDLWAYTINGRSLYNTKYQKQLIPTSCIQIPRPHNDNNRTYIQ